MTFEAKLHIMNFFRLYYVSIYTTFLQEQILNIKDI